MYTLVASLIISILLLKLCSVSEGCIKLTTIDKTRQTLQLKKIWNEEAESNLTLEMNPFLIRTESGRIGITLSETLNDTNSRCYQIFLQDWSPDNFGSGCLQISNKWTGVRDKCTKQFSVDFDDVEIVIVINISPDGVISLKVNNKTKFIYKDRETPINVQYISIASTDDDSYNEFYFNCFDPATNRIKY